MRLNYKNFSLLNLAFFSFASFYAYANTTNSSSSLVEFLGGKVLFTKLQDLQEAPFYMSALKESRIKDPSINFNFNPNEQINLVEQNNSENSPLSLRIIQLQVKANQAIIDKLEDKYNEQINEERLYFRKDQFSNLAKRGILKTGDLVLSYRHIWKETEEYAHIQMGVSHAGLVYVDDKNIAHNLDMPLSTSYNGADYNSSFDSDMYLEVPAMQVIRWQKMDEKKKQNLLGWIKLLKDGMKSIRKTREDGRTLLAFNDDYLYSKYNDFALREDLPAADKISPNVFQSLTKKLESAETQESKDKITDEINEFKKSITEDPRYAGNPAWFVNALANIILKARSPNKQVYSVVEKNLTMYCSEFAYAMLALSNCKPPSYSTISALGTNINEDFSSKKYNSCLNEQALPMRPMRAFEQNIALPNKQIKKYPGLASGPYLIAKGLSKSLNGSALKNEIDSMFTFFKPNPDFSSGHREAAQMTKFLVAAVKPFYYYPLKIDPPANSSINDIAYMVDKLMPDLQPKFSGPIVSLPPGDNQYNLYTNMIGALVNNFVYSNYSPTAFLVNTMIPENDDQFIKRSFSYVGTILVDVPQN